MPRRSAWIAPADYGDPGDREREIVYECSKCNTTKDFAVEPDYPPRCRGTAEQPHESGPMTRTS